MTIAQQVAHDFLESIEKMITANKLDVGVLDTKVSYQSCEEAMMSVTDTKTGSIIATMRLNVNTNKLKREMQEKELGDVMWYVAMICESFNWSLDEIMQMNIKKLEKRYPDGFDVIKANNRRPEDV